MKVFIMTRAKPFEEETYLGVALTKKRAEKRLRELYPHMKPCGGNTYVADNTYSLLLFIREEEVL